MERKWIIVEDDQAKMRAYVRSFIEIYKGDNPPFTDQVTFLVFSDKDKIEVDSQGSLLITSVCLKSSDAISAYADSVKNWKSDIIVLLDFLIDPPGLPVLQNRDNVVTNWLSIDERVGDDVICLVTTEYDRYIDVGKFPKKGILGACEVNSSDPTVLLSKAKRNILQAHQDWTDRYAHPGKKLLHALMLAQPIGHVDRRESIYPSFPFKEVLDEDTYCLDSFKALFYLPDERHRICPCNEQTLVRVMLECGIGCEVSVSSDSDFVKFPVAPGALYLFRLCYLIRILRDEKYANPVSEVEFVFKEGKFVAKLHFEKIIQGLEEAFCAGGQGQTVPLLKSFEEYCVPLAPRQDLALKRTFDMAASSTPLPEKIHVATVSAMEPRPLNGRIKVQFEPNSIIINHI